MKKGKNEKNKGKMLIFLLLLIIIIAIVLFLLFSCNKNYTVTFDSDGGSLIANLVIKNGEIINSSVGAKTKQQILAMLE